MGGHWLAGISSLFGACVLAELLAGSIEGTAYPMIVDEAGLLSTQGIADRRAAALMPAGLSHDGRLIAFVAQDRSVSGPICCQHVYTLDRSTGLTTLETFSPDGSRANGDSESPSLSSDGRILAFETFASNLVSGDMPLESSRVVVRDRRSGRLRAPVGPLRETPNGYSAEPVVAGSGIAVAFTSAATNLVSEPDRNGSQTDIYLWQLDNGSITRVSVDSNGVQPSIGISYSPTLSSDGKRVAFVSTAQLAPEDTNDVPDVYVRDLQCGVTSLARAATGTTSSNAPSYLPQLSADGRYVAFVSKSHDFAPRDRNDDSDVFVYEVATRSVTLVSATAAGDTANAWSSRPAISADGRYVVFQSVASNLGTRRGCPPRVPDKNLLPDVYLLDRTTGCLTRISGSPAGEWWTPSVAPAISGSGKIVLFSSSHPVRQDDVTTDFDLFVYIRTESRSAAAVRTLSVPSSER